MPAEPAAALTWHRVAALDDLPVGVAVGVEVGGVPICLVRDEHGVHALFDECSHESVPLSEGEVDGEAIECWRHGSRFDLTSGDALNLPATEPVPVIPVRVGDDGDVYVDLGALGVT